MKIARSILFFLLLCSVFYSSIASAESLFVTDRILLGIHQEPTEDSALIKSIPSGESVEVIEKKEGFIKIKTNDGAQGWVNEQFLLKEKPATAQFDGLFDDYQKNLATLKTLNAKLTKNEREIQLLRDELSNAQNAMKKLMKKQGGETAIAVDTEIIEKLSAANQQIETLQAKISELEAQQAVTQSLDGQDAEAVVKMTREENTALRARIELAVASLKGEKAPTANELAGLRPSFPPWYWGLVLVAIIFGIIVGASVIDYRYRKRHGGFRV